MGVGGVVREFFEWAFVWGDVDPHGGGLGACEPDGCTVCSSILEKNIVFLQLS